MARHDTTFKPIFKYVTIVYKGYGIFEEIIINFEQFLRDILLKLHNHDKHYVISDLFSR